MRFLTALLFLLATAVASADTTITYQGQLQDGAGPHSGSVDMVFELFDAETGGSQVGSNISLTDVSVADGLFQVDLDFGNVPYADGLWLAIEVEGEPLEPRQAITGAPFAISSASGTGSNWKLGGNAGIDPATDFVGTTDETALEIRVDGQRAFRLEPAVVPNVIGGWEGNTVDAGVSGATIGGGGCPEFDFGTVLCDGESFNEVTANLGTIGGGLANNASGAGSTIAGGAGNSASGTGAAIGGGQANTASDSLATVGGGGGNTASEFATVGGGLSNTASGMDATVGGGYENTAIGAGATVGGGWNNIASGVNSSVAGGRGNQASGDYSLAAGRRANAEHDGAFVWADSTDADLASTDQDQFLIRAGGGVGIGTNAPEYALDVDGAIRGSVIRSGGQGIFESTIFVGALGSGSGSEELCRVPATGRVAACSSSSLRYKENIEDLSLGWADIRAMRPVSYRFLEGGMEDIGLIAEELVEIDERLVVLDEEGRPDSIRYGRLSVFLIAAMQEYDRYMQDRLAEVERENAELRELAERNTELEDRLATLEALLLEDRQVAEQSQ